MENQEKSESTPLPSSIGEQLRAAREAQGRTLADIAAQTRVAERHLAAIEEGRFSDLAAPTYAVGFSRSYARVVGMNEADVAARVRRLLDAQAHTRRPPTMPSFEPGDPARVPPTRIAWIAGLLAVVTAGILLFYWNGFLSPEGRLPDLLPEASEGATGAALPEPLPPPSPPVQAAPGGPVVLTAMGPKVWVKVTDAGGNQIFQKEMAQGESWIVPDDAQTPRLRTARPDMLQISLAGRALPRLSDKPQVISGVDLTPAALNQRAAPAPASSAAGTQPGPTPPAARRPDVPPLPRMDDLLNGIEAAPADNRDPLSTTAQ